ncbi:hypothetical protein [Oceanicoccus sp. KOV_DT_Chl]|uniref:hypothetical protein n=1 Tax=Oceanicoccus sp. KOV_DT_Chl TaxID=1904639 RepID=UPI000C7CA64C|nr:hypothetical protein [Oceanicoccus sp. KOV_DT_Chl]
MKKTLFFVILFAVGAAIYFLQLPSAVEPVVDTVATQHGLPWQIELRDGSSRVFGITLGVSTLADATTVINRDFELAILAKHKQVGALEIFYRDFMAGQLQGKLILVVDVDDALLTSLIDGAASGEMLDNGTKKFQLAEQQLASVQQLLIRSITFAPTARLDREMIEQRFGVAPFTEAANESVNHYLYPELGLDILIDDNGKDLLEYVAPKKFGLP